MRSFLVRRLLHAVFVVWGVVTVVFFLVRLTGDPTLFLVDQSATQEEIAHMRAFLGLDRPLVVQYVDFVGADLRLPVALLVILIVLLVRPAGLFGKPVTRRV